MSFYVDVKKGKFKAAMRALSEQPTSKIEAALLKGGKIVANDAKSEAPPGKIPKNITYVLTGAGTKEVEVTVGLPKKIFWAHFVEFGTSGHEIEPKNKEALSWVPKIGKFEFQGKKKVVKKMVYRKADGSYTTDKSDARIIVMKVDHPGGPAKPFLFPAYNRNKPKIKEMLASAMGVVVQDAAKEGVDD